jgi:hypothetical protein
MRHRLLPFIDSVLTVVVIGYAVYSLTSDSGLYAWLAELQATVFGTHIPILTGGLAALPPTAVALGLHALAKRVLGEPPVTHFSQTRFLAQMGFGMLAAGLVAGWVAYGRYSRTNEYVLVDVANPPAVLPRYVELTGTDQTTAAIGVQLGDTRTQYTPVTAPSWVPTQPVTFFGQGASFLQAAPGVAEKRVRRGVLVKNGLPSVARAGFAQRGGVLATPHYLLDPSPLSEILPYVIALLGLLFGPLCLVIALIAARRTGAQRQRHLR